MVWLKLGSLSVGSLTTTLLLGVITVYLLALRKKSRDAWFLTGYIAVLFILLLSYTVRYSVYSRAGIRTGQISNLIVFGIVCLVQFAYHYGGNIFPKESRIALVLILTAAITAWASIFFTELTEVYDFHAQYFTFDFDTRISVVTLAGYIWAIVVLLRKTIAFSGDGSTRGKSIEFLFRPSGRSAHSSRSFALLILSMTAVALLYLLFSADVISRAVYAFIFNTSSLLICLFIYIVYVNNAPQPTRFRTKLVGIPLATVMVMFGIAASSLMPVISDVLSDRYTGEVKALKVNLEAAVPSEIPDNVAFVVPVSATSDGWTYRDERIPREWLSEAAELPGTPGLLREKHRLEPHFLYLHLEDTNSFFFYYVLEIEDTDYRVGFYYSDLRGLYHQFWSRLALIVAGAAVLVVILFPVLFQRGLLKPLSNLLEAVGQVETGHFDLVLPVFSEDDVGQLTRGYNRMAKSLKNAEGNFKALAENANDAILLLSREGEVIYANGRASEISGFSAVELRKKHFREVIHPEELPSISERFAMRMKGHPVPPCYETRIIGREGNVIPVELTGARTVWQDEIADVVVIRDITERRKAEELLRTQQQQLLQADKLASLGALVAGVAHEVSNPNQVVSMNARFLSEGLPGIFSLSESAEEMDENIRIAGLTYPEFRIAAESAIREIDENTLRIDHIVSELKSFVRQEESGPMEKTDMNEVIRRVVKLSRHFIRNATDSFEVKTNDNLPGVNGDRIRLEQVVLNLIQNACQALPGRDRGISVSTRYDSSSRSVLVEVRDEGVGIPEADLPRITDPFFTTRRKAGGTGLGLSVSNRIIRSHGGELTFSSEQGKGTTAVIRLPAAS